MDSQSKVSNKGLAVVTGASSGIGLELARVFAENGYNLLIAAEDDAIKDAERELSQSGVSVRSIQVDLATPEGNETLCKEVQTAGSVDILALNAGVGVHGDFVRDIPLEDSVNLIRLNILSPVHLTKRLVGDMIQRGQGKVLYTSSVVSAMPGPYESVYAASKAFLQSFAQAVRNELKDTGVTVTSLMPGATETEFFERAGMEDTKIGTSKKDDPAQVARDGYKALMAGKDHVVAGSIKNKTLVAAAKILSQPATAQLHRTQSEPGSGSKDKKTA